MKFITALMFSIVYFDTVCVYHVLYKQFKHVYLPNYFISTLILIKKYIQNCMTCPVFFYFQADDSTTAVSHVTVVTTVQKTETGLTVSFIFSFCHFYCISRPCPFLTNAAFLSGNTLQGIQAYLGSLCTALNQEVSNHATGRFIRMFLNV